MKRMYPSFGAACEISFQAIDQVESEERERERETVGEREKEEAIEVAGKLYQVGLLGSKSGFLTDLEL